MNIPATPFYLTPLVYVFVQYFLCLRLFPSTNIPGICRVAIGAVACWISFHLFIVPVYGNVLLATIREVPHNIKCFPAVFPECTRGNIDGWSVYHMLDHFVMGFLYPPIKENLLAAAPSKTGAIPRGAAAGKHAWEVWFVLFQSFVCELGELAGGERARFIVDPGVNVLGYMMGWAGREVWRVIRGAEPRDDKVGVSGVSGEGEVLLIEDLL